MTVQGRAAAVLDVKLRPACFAARRPEDQGSYQLALLDVADKRGCGTALCGRKDVAREQRVSKRGRAGGAAKLVHQQDSHRELFLAWCKADGSPALLGCFLP